MPETHSQHMFAEITFDLQVLAERVCFERVPAEVHTDAL